MAQAREVLIRTLAPGSRFAFFLRRKDCAAIRGVAEGRGVGGGVLVHLDARLGGKRRRNGSWGPGERTEWSGRIYVTVKG